MQLSRSARSWLAAAAGFAAPLALTAILVPFRGSFANTDAALALILVVVAVAASGNRLAGLLAAISGAAWFDFFLTKPYEQFAINRAVDIETTVLLLVIGVAVTEIAVWGHRQQASASRRAGYLAGIGAGAQAVAAGESPAVLIEQVSARLTGLLALRSCSFQFGAAGLGFPARLQSDGQVMLRRLPVDIEDSGWPGDTDVELLAEAGGILRGRFLCSPKPGARPTLEQRLVAVALADQVGAALAASQPAER
jgi:hypothetical protein